MCPVDRTGCPDGITKGTAVSTGRTDAEETCFSKQKSANQIRKSSSKHAYCCSADCQKNFLAEGFGGKKSVKGNRQGFLSRSITRRSGQNCKIILHFYILQFCRHLVKKVPLDFFDKVKSSSKHAYCCSVLSLHKYRNYRRMRPPMRRPVAARRSASRPLGSRTPCAPSTNRMAR